MNDRKILEREDRLTAAPVQTATEQEAAFVIRMRVFVEEQGVPPEEELDALDITATHFIVRDSALEPGSDIVGTARLVDKGGGAGKVGRVAILREHRGRGAGRAIMLCVEAFSRENGFEHLVLDAQCSAIPFYERLGYTAEGDVFLDCDIEHRKMFKPL